MGREPIKIAIDARLVDGSSGGVQQLVMGLASGLGRLDGPEQYSFLTFDESDAWLRPYLGPNSRILSVGSGHSNVKNMAKKFIPASKGLWRFYNLLRLKKISPNIEDLLTRNKISLVHFTHQAAFFTRHPNIYHPHDLQHIHLPQFFPRSERIWRSASYRFFCRNADLVAVSSSWTKDDLIRHFGLPADKVQVVPLAPPLAISGDAAARPDPPPGVPTPYLFYPAMFWPHKNHLALIQALRHLKERRGLAIPTVFSGGEGPFRAVVEKALADSGLQDQVHIAGYIPQPLVGAYFAHARAVCIPTLFEAGSFPAWEAFHAGVPLACSRVTSLPAQILDAGLLFDPGDIGQMAEAIERLWTDEALREDLVARGTRRLREFSWDSTARAFRALYRRTCGRDLSPDDKNFIDTPPIM